MISSTNKKPLEGVTIIELAQFVAGPSATRILAEWGAKVIKLEGFNGDHNRIMGLLNDMPIEDDENPSFDTTSFNKKFVGLNPRKPEGMDILHKMLKTANVFMTNYRTPVLEKMGLTYEILHEKYPHLIFAQLTGYGNKGPDKDVPGYDTISYGARGGIIGTMYQKGQEPINLIPAAGDFTTGMVFAGGIAGALVGQALHGTGDKITVSLYHVGMWFNIWPIMATEYHDTPQYPRSRLEVNTPGINIYPTSDRWIQLSCPTYNDYYDRLMQCIGRNDLVGDTKYNDLATIQKEGRVREVINLLDDALSKKPVAYWKPIFDAAEVPIEPCCTFEDIAEDQQAWEAEFLYKAKSPNGEEHLHVASPVQFGSVGQPEANPSRRVGYHTREILAQYGYSEVEIDNLVETGAVKD
ncbi:CaiB/BaiF CoA transferase family protein [Eubacterium barkeri]|uniref:Cinnamoyl-CoA:phenyllactate CoA-transferase n=1 Tax=Eubacterium barkeri TaxID=1528 RepID=A0A1H3I6L6_EUBBA|nr:CoA transferase [Eubacterium barkeri]SDY22614.1 cinnamoyl-CoA:phenyllactate CoA-transferase [Eubacterium barkeri]